MKRLRFALFALTLTASACATAGPETPGSFANFWTINFENFSSGETGLIIDALEEEYDWSAQNLSGGSGYMSVEVATAETIPETYLKLQNLIEATGYNLETLQIISSGSGTFTVARVVDDGFRPD